MSLHQASTASRQLQSQGLPARSRAPGRPVPDGTTHAVRGDSLETLCGVPVSQLKDWPDTPWENMAVDRCPECNRLSKAT